MLRALLIALGRIDARNGTTLQTALSPPSASICLVRRVLMLHRAMFRNVIVSQVAAARVRFGKPTRSLATPPLRRPISLLKRATSADHLICPFWYLM